MGENSFKFLFFDNKVCVQLIKEFRIIFIIIIINVMIINIIFYFIINYKVLYNILVIIIFFLKCQISRFDLLVL